MDSPQDTQSQLPNTPRTRGPKQEPKDKPTAPGPRQAHSTVTVPTAHSTERPHSPQLVRIFGAVLLAHVDHPTAPDVIAHSFPLSPRHAPPHISSFLWASYYYVIQGAV